MQGVESVLPDCYGGVLLRSNSFVIHVDSPTKRAEKGTGRTTRSSQLKPKEEVQVDYDDPMALLDMEDTGFETSASEQNREAKTLHPSHVFSSLVVWHPDVPVDQGHDEYVRALTERTAVAAEVCARAFSAFMCGLRLIFKLHKTED